MQGAWLEFAGLSLGLAAWAGLRLASHRRLLGPKALAWTLLAAGLGMRTLFAFGTPVFDAPDEQSHLAYVRYLSERRALPVQTEQAAREGSREYCQPPLYYLLLAPVYGLTAAGRSEASAVVLLRLATVLLWALQFGLVWSLAQALALPPLLEAGLLVFSALLPSAAFIGAAVNNDACLAALSAAVMLLLIRGRTPAASLAAGLLLGLAFYAKYTAVFIAAFTGLWLLLEWRERPDPRQALLRAACVVLPAAALWAPWAARNLNLYGALFPAGALGDGSRPHWSSLSHALGRILGYMVVTFWGAAGGSYGFQYRRILTWVLTLVPLWGLLRMRAGVRPRLEAPARRFLLAGAGALLAAAALTFRFGWTSGQSQGRYLYSLLPALALLWTLGAEAAAGGWLLPADLAGLFLTYLLAFAGKYLG